MAQTTPRAAPPTVVAADAKILRGKIADTASWDFGADFDGLAFQDSDTGILYFWDAEATPPRFRNIRMT